MDALVELGVAAVLGTHIRITTLAVMDTASGDVNEGALMVHCADAHLTRTGLLFARVRVDTAAGDRNKLALICVWVAKAVVASGCVAITLLVVSAASRDLLDATLVFFGVTLAHLALGRWGAVGLGLAAIVVCLLDDTSTFRSANRASTSIWGLWTVAISLAATGFLDLLAPVRRLAHVLGAVVWIRVGTIDIGLAAPVDRHVHTLRLHAMGFGAVFGV